MKLLTFIYVLIPWVYSAKILGVFFYPGYSHTVFFYHVYRELSSRGHEVTLLTPSPSNDSSSTKITEIDIKFKFDTRHNGPKYSETSMFENMHNYMRFATYLVENSLKHTNFQNFLSSNNQQFDLIFMQCSSHPVTYDFSRQFKAPTVCLSPSGVLTPTKDVVGNPGHFTLVRDYMVAHHERKLSVGKKLELLVFNLWARLWLNWVYRRKDLSEALFGKAGRGMEHSVKMVALVANPVLTDPTPNVPGVLELGLLGVKPNGSMPEAVQKFLDGATRGAIYLSLGTVVRLQGSALGEAILAGLADLPYKVLIKWKCESIGHRYGNILCRDWLPQTKVLEHPNVNVFVTHGGLNSIEESICAGVPLVGIPFITDQPMNVYKFTEQGMGKALNPVSLTSDRLKSAIIEVAENKKYRNRVLEVREILLDKPRSSLSMLVWWTEYIIRHRGALHLRSPYLDISWLSYLLVDVMLVFSTIAMCVFLCFFCAARYIISKC